MADTAALALLFLLVATLYASVGHAGASGYLAIMALLGTAPAQMKPTALALNIVVSVIATLNFRRAGIFYPRQVLPLALTSVPLAFLGCTIHPAASWYRPLVGALLAFAAARSLVRRAPAGEAQTEPRVRWAPALGIGAAIGLLSGLTGTGGGIFLSPIVVFLGWATVRQSAGISALFVLVNSLAGLAGAATTFRDLPPEMPVLAAAAGIGGFIGSRLGANRLSERTLSVALGAVLLLASAKLLFTGD